MKLTEDEAMEQADLVGRIEALESLTPVIGNHGIQILELEKQQKNTLILMTKLTDSLEKIVTKMCSMWGGKTIE